jgi:hypothetical protein
MPYRRGTVVRLSTIQERRLKPNKRQIRLHVSFPVWDDWSELCSFGMLHDCHTTGYANSKEVLNGVL